MAEIEHLKTLQAVRERSRLVLQAAKDGKTNNFDYHPERMKDVTEFVASVIDVSIIIIIIIVYFISMPCYRSALTRLSAA